MSLKNNVDEIRNFVGGAKQLSTKIKDMVGKEGQDVDSNTLNKARAEIDVLDQIIGKISSLVG